MARLTKTYFLDTEDISLETQADKIDAIVRRHDRERDGTIVSVQVMNAQRDWVQTGSVHMGQYSDDRSDHGLFVIITYDDPDA